MDNPCKEWTGTIQSDGYGFDKHKLVHRIEWEKHNGPIPPGMVIMHECDNKACYEISHLRLGTWSRNQRDAYTRGLRERPNGEKNGRAKLSEKEVCAIKILLKAGLAHEDIAKEFGVSKPTISDINRGKTWSHVTIS